MKNKKPLRVLYFDHTATLGGGEIALLNLIRRLDRNVVEPIVVLGAEGPLSNALKGDAEVHVLPLPEQIGGARKDKLGLVTLFQLRQIVDLALYIRRLKHFIRQDEIEIVHTNSLKADVIGGIAARLSRTPIIWHVRDRIENDYLPASVVKVFRKLARYIPTAIVANSAATLNSLELSEKDQRSCPYQEVVHDGTTLPADTTSPHKKDNLQIGLIGRISPWKGQDVFLKSAANVITIFPNARFKIVGSAMFGAEAYEKSVRELCTQLGLDEAVEFSGFRPDISEVLAELDLVVHASTTGEPFGQVIIEAMAAAKPVVATRGGGVPEIVIHEETGLLVPMSDPLAMSEAICQLLNNPDQRCAMGMRGRERVRDFFTIEKTAKGIEDVYKIIAGRFKERSVDTESPEADLAYTHQL